MTKIRGIVVGAAIALLLAACGGDGGTGNDVQELPDGPADVASSSSYEYEDGLVITASAPREVTLDVYDGTATTTEEAIEVDLIASNPTDAEIRTTQAWISMRAGESGEKLTETFADSSTTLDAVLQPGAEVTGTATFVVPHGTEHLALVVDWLESRGERESAELAVG